jgi:hypothetical protein
MGAVDVEQQSATPTLTLGDMPASPHQVAGRRAADHGWRIGAVDGELADAERS